MPASNVYKASLIILALLINLEGTLDVDIVLFSVHLLNEPISLSSLRKKKTVVTLYKLTSLITISILYLTLRMGLLLYMI